MNLGVETHGRRHMQKIGRQFQHSLMNLGVETFHPLSRLKSRSSFSIL